MKLPLIFGLVLYILILFVRYQQGGWEIELDLFPSFRQSLDQKITQTLPSPQAELLSGILLGNKKDLPIDLKLDLRDTSTLHMVVVSGQNLSLVGGFFLMLAGLIKRRTAIFLAFGAIVFYTILTGAQIPVVRAAIMAILGLGAEAIGRQKDGIWGLSLAGGGLLLVNPLWLWDLSFQLSFLATLGVIAVAPLAEKVFNFLPIFLKQDLAITVGAQVMVMPVIIQNFHQFSLVGILANLLISWTIPFIMIAGTIMLALGFIWQFLGFIFAIFVSAFLTYFIYIAGFFASLPFAWEYVGEQGLIVWMGYYLVVGGMLIALRNIEK